MKSKDLAQFNLRLPRDLRDWLKAEAISNRRTATAEILLILEKHRAAKEIGDSRHKEKRPDCVNSQGVDSVKPSSTKE